MISLLRGLNNSVEYIDRRQSNLKEIPDDIFSFSKTLEELLLDSNHIRSLPKGLFRLSKLQKLSLSENELLQLSPSLSNLTNLVELDVSKNTLLEIPDNLQLLKQLQVADFSCNPLKRLPNCVILLQSLTDLRLNDIDLRDLQSDFGRLVNLKSLELRDNSLKSLPSSFVSLVKLECLDLGNNLFEQMPSCICQLVKLEELWLDCNEISFLPKEIGKLQSLKCLDVSENDLQSLPEEFDKLESLTDLYASQNYLELLPSNFGKLQMLMVMKVDNNRLTYLPEDIGSCSNVQELMLKDNELSIVPISIGKLKNLTTLNVDNNKLLDLPSEICNLSKLSLLSVRDNCLRYMPDDIGKLKDLQVLDVSGNRLQYLPASILQLNLKALWLSENQNQPLLKFQKDIDWKSKKAIITCYMLPQQGFSIEELDDPEDFQEEKIQYSQRVNFENEGLVDMEKLSPLVRHGTPYMKELKAKFLKFLPQKLKDIDGQILNAGDKERMSEPFRPHRLDDSEQSSGEALNGHMKDENGKLEVKEVDSNKTEDKTEKYESPKIIESERIETPPHNDPNCNAKEPLKICYEDKSVTEMVVDGRKENSNINGAAPIISSKDAVHFKFPSCKGELIANSVSEILTIYLNREETGLGLCIAGGKGSTPFKGEDQGIFVSKITQSGPSDRAGLKINDKIMKINEVSMDNIDHYSAVLSMKNAGDNIKLTLLRDKEISKNQVNYYCSLPRNQTYDQSSPNFLPKCTVSPSPSNHEDIEPVMMNGNSSHLHHLAPKVELLSCPTSSSVSPDVNVCGLPPIRPTTQSNGPSNSNQSQFPNPISSFEPDMTSTPLSLSRASSKNIPDLIQPANLNTLVQSACHNDDNNYEGPIVTVTIQNPKPYLPLKQEFPPATKAFGKTVEVLSSSSYSETTTKRITNNVLSESSNIEEVLLSKKSGPLGLSIIGGYDQSCLPFGIENPGIFISKVVPNGVAGRTGKLRVGDRLLEVNGFDLRQATHNGAVSALSLAASEMLLLVQHDPLPPGWQEITFTILPHDILGVDINGGVHGPCANPFDYEDEGVFIVKILPNSAAARDSRLRVGMRLIQFCDTSFLGATCEEAHRTLNNAQGSISFTVCDGFNLSITQNNSYGHAPESCSVTIDSIPLIDSDDDDAELHNNNLNLVLHQQKTIDAKVLDVVRAAERLVNPSPQFHLQPMVKKKTTTITLSKHTVTPASSNTVHQDQSEPTYLPCEV